MANENRILAGVPSEYYIGPNDRSTDAIVHFSLRSDGKNYLRWSECMMIALVMKGKHVFVDGTLPPPERDSPGFVIWRRCDDLVKSWICNSIEKDSDLYRNSIHAKSASVLWKDLQHLFSAGSSARIYEVVAEISRLRQGGLTVAEYFTKLTNLWSELDCYLPGCTCECGAAKYSKAKDNERLCQFLIGLEPDQFQTAKFKILSSASLPSLKEAYSMVVLEEKLEAVSDAVY